MRIKYLIIVISLMPLAASAEGGEAKKSQNFVAKSLMWVKTLIDSMAVASIDRSYIEQPKLPWAVELRTSISQSYMKVSSDWPLPEGNTLKFDALSDNGFSTSVGAWVGYRGYGFGLSKELSSGSGSTLSFGAMGGSFGINLRINSYRSHQPEVSIDVDVAGEKFSDRDKVDLDDPIDVRTLFIDGYYMFNGKHFSYAAAYDQSLIQRRSAGSLVAGLMYYHSRVSYDDDSNWPMVQLMNCVGKTKLTQGSIGLGYAYNWVLARGWLVSAQAMPMLALYNRMNVYTYSLIGEDGLPFEKSENEYDEYTLVEKDVTKTNNRVTWNFDARFCVCYNWSRWYVRAYAHYNRFSYSNDDEKGRLTDWTAYASLGFRF